MKRMSVVVVATVLFGPSVCWATAACTADCNGDRLVTVDEVLKAVSISLSQTPLNQCAASDSSKDGQVTVNEVIQATTAALKGCHELVQRIVRLDFTGTGSCYAFISAGTDITYGRYSITVETSKESRGQDVVCSIPIPDDISRLRVIDASLLYGPVSINWGADNNGQGGTVRLLIDEGEDHEVNVRLARKETPQMKKASLPGGEVSIPIGGLGSTLKFTFRVGDSWINHSTRAKLDWVRLAIRAEVVPTPTPTKRRSTATRTPTRRPTATPTTRRQSPVPTATRTPTPIQGLLCPNTTGDGTNGLSFPSQTYRYQLSTQQGTASVNGLITWGVRFSNPEFGADSSTGSLRASLWALSFSFDGRFEGDGFRIATALPNFVGEGARSPNQIYNFHSVTNIETSVSGTSPPRGRYCMVLFLEQFDRSTCDTSDRYCYVDWFQFEGAEFFR